jgi:hypothetical protein
MSAAANGRETTCEASCRTLLIIFGAPDSAAATLFPHDTTAVGWRALSDQARSVDPTRPGARSCTPQRVKLLRCTMGQQHSGHEAMFVTRAAAHESSRVLDSPGSGTRTPRRVTPTLLRAILPQRESTTDDSNEAVVSVTHATIDMECCRGHEAADHRPRHQFGIPDAMSDASSPITAG